MVIRYFDTTIKNIIKKKSLVVLDDDVIDIINELTK